MPFTFNTDEINEYLKKEHDKEKQKITNETQTRFVIETPKDILLTNRDFGPNKDQLPYDKGIVCEIGKQSNFYIAEKFYGSNGACLKVVKLGNPYYKCYIRTTKNYGVIKNSIFIEQNLETLNIKFNDLEGCFVCMNNLLNNSVQSVIEKINDKLLGYFEKYEDIIKDYI